MIQIMTVIAFLFFLGVMLDSYLRTRPVRSKKEVLKLVESNLDDIDFCRRLDVMLHGTTRI
jgi:hypothetical protein